MTKPFEDSPAAIFIRRQIELLSYRKSQREIAHEAGFVNANLITMLKQGSTRIPLDRVPALARALETDAGYFMQLALEQAIGKTAAIAVRESFGEPTSLNERAWLQEIRDASYLSGFPALTWRWSAC